MPTATAQRKSKARSKPRGRSAAASRSTKPATATATPPKIQKTVYFTEAEWRAVRRTAFEQDRRYTDIVREAVREKLALD